MATVYLVKKVTGNMGDRSATFQFTVSVMDGSKSVTIPGVTDVDYVERKHSDNAADVTNRLGAESSFPIGATVTIVETAVDGYTTTIEGGTPVENEKNTVTFTVSESGNTITFKNNREIEVDTGIPMESKPYWFLLGLIPLAGLGAVLMAKRRRREEA